MDKLIFASNNSGKIRELQALLQEFKLSIVPQSEYNIQDIPETGLTFVENAILKARNACLKTGFPALADDSGLVVDALDGEPGIYSARYAGTNATSQDNINHLLQALSNKNILESKYRTASFHCVLVYLASANDPIPLICHGSWQGLILKKPRGNEGFGYDPIFFVPTHDCSAAELPLDIKNRISHRGKAFRAFVEKLPQKLCLETV